MKVHSGDNPYSYQRQPSVTDLLLVAYELGTPYCLSAQLQKFRTTIMPVYRTGARNKKPPPDGFEDIEDTLLEFSNKMKDAENASHEGKKKYEMLWPIFQITHQRTSCPQPILKDLWPAVLSWLDPLMIYVEYGC